MSEIHHRGEEHIAFPNQNILAFPTLGFHFSEGEVGHKTYPVNEGNSEYIAERVSVTMNHALDAGRALLFASPISTDALLMQRSGEATVFFGRRQNDDLEGFSVFRWQCEGTPKIDTLFDADGLTIDVGERGRDEHRVRISAGAEDSFLLLSGNVDTHGTNRYVHEGKRESLRTVSESKNKGSFAEIHKAIAETERALREGKLLKTYYEMVSGEGDVILYKEITAASTAIQRDFGLLHRKVMLASGDRWYFSP